MRQSFLMNERIYLRAVEPEDMDIMYEMENDPSMWDISNFTVPYSRYVLRQYIEGSQCDVFADKQLRLMMVRVHRILLVQHSLRTERGIQGDFGFSACTFLGSHEYYTIRTS